jgi:NAD(P)-dependent dehydrogenase (short-subunit alcohol dehydrogenase family)
MKSLQGMRVIVTGAAGGIGSATVSLLASQGARLVLADMSKAACESIISGLQMAAAGEAVAAECDVRSAAACDSLVSLSVEHYGGVDALVHCAGILRKDPRPRPLHDLTDDEYNIVVGTNLKGTFLINRAVLHQMIKQRGGQIVNLSSTSGRKGRPLDSLYSASKAGVIALSESIAEEVRGFGIRVQVVLPDAVDTPLWRQNGPGAAPPSGSLSAERVAEILAFCLALPEDAMLENLVIMPRKIRRRQSASTPGANTSTET